MSNNTLPLQNHVDALIKELAAVAIAKAVLAMPLRSAA